MSPSGCARSSGCLSWKLRKALDVLKYNNKSDHATVFLSIVGRGEGTSVICGAFETQGEFGCGTVLQGTYTRRRFDGIPKMCLERPQSRRERPARGPLRLNDQAVPSTGLASRVSATNYWVYSNHTELVGSGVVVGYQWFKVRVLRDCNLTISLCEHEQGS